MKIERLSENQIRCILTGEDLAKRQLRLSELAYGTDKARRLFQDMMQQAATQFGFEAENFPLMIEAVPLSSDSIALVVTKVENPEELDTRFSSFAPSVQRGARQPGSGEQSVFEQLLQSLKDSFAQSLGIGGSEASDPAQAPSSASSAEETPHGSSAAQPGTGVSGTQLTYAQRMREFTLTHRLFSFERFRDLTLSAAEIGSAFPGRSSLYRDPDAGLYYLLLSTDTQEEMMGMQSVLAALSEYGTPTILPFGREQSMLEHYDVVIAEGALGLLANMND